METIDELSAALPHAQDTHEVHGYPYMPLNPEVDEIRLLLLDTVPSDDPIVACTLTHSSLFSEPDFIAVSYVWGDPDDTVPVCIDGHLVNVGRNLRDALARFRAGGFERFIWVDALCIDQANVPEKNVQVQLMSKIFSLANEVIVWLGNETDDGGLAALCELRRQFKAFPKDASDHSSEVRNRRFTDLVVRNSMAKSGFPGASPTTDPRFAFDFRAILGVVQRPWWRRVWVIQEVILARRGRVCCGPGPGDPLVPWFEVLHALDIITTMKSIMSPAGSFARCILDIKMRTKHLIDMSMHYRRSRAKAASYGTSHSLRPGVPLALALYEIQTTQNEYTFNDGRETRGIQATDPRDIVYGVLGTVAETDRAFISVDYGSDNTLAKVLFVAGRSFLYQYGPGILMCCQGDNLSTEGLPSWVPDWSIRSRSNIGDAKGLIVHGEQRAASRDINACGEIGWTPNPTVMQTTWEDPRVYLRGRLLDARVARLSHAMSRDGNAIDVTKCRKHARRILAMMSIIGSNQANAATVINSRANAWRVMVTGTRPSKTATFARQFDILAGELMPPDNLPVAEGETLETARLRWAEAETVEYRMEIRLRGCRFFVDDYGRPGIGPKTMEPLDVIAVFAGATTPVALRQVDGSGKYRVLGVVYLCGVMAGEAFEGVSSADKLDEICLV